MPVACLWVKAFNIPLSTLHSCKVHALLLGPHAIFLSHHTPGEAQLAVFDDLSPSQHDCDAPVES